MKQFTERGAAGSAGRSNRSATRWWLVALAMAGLSSAASAYVQDFSAVGAGYTANYKIYVPPSNETPRIKAVVFLYAGSGGDARSFATFSFMQQAARSMGVALIAADAYGYSAIGSNHAQAEASLNAILSQAASVTGHSELVNVPIMSTGTSLGGFSSTKWAYYLPERTIAIAAHRGANYFSSSASAASQYVHTLILPGSKDTNSITKPDMLRDDYNLWRSGTTDGRAAWAVDWQAGHDAYSSNQSWPMGWTWLAESLDMRYPQNQLPSKIAGNVVQLNNVALEDGWLGQQAFATSTTGADRSSFVNIAPYSSYVGDKGLASWLPNETIARAYQAMTSYDGNTTRTAVPLQGPLAIVGDAAPPVNTDSNQWIATHLAYWNVGSTINITVDPREFDDSRSIVRMEYYDGATLLGVQTSTTGSTWNLPYTLTTQGIHTLTVVATDALGNQTSAFRPVAVTPVKVTSMSHWRFETGSTKMDRYDNNDLWEATNESNRGTFITKPTTGAGSKFVDFGFLDGENQSTMKFQASKSQFIVTKDAPLLSGGANGQFTVEAMVNLASTDAGGAARAIIGQGGYHATSMGWLLMVTSETSGRGARNLIFQFTSDGKGGSGGNMDTIDSDIQLTLGVDYYIALAFNPADTTLSGATFYVKDLTNDGPMQIVKRGHTFTSLYDSTLSMFIGAGNYNNYWDGLIDEVRFSSSLLSESDLLISQVPEPASLLSLVAIGSMLFKRRTRG